MIMITNTTTVIMTRDGEDIHINIYLIYARYMQRRPSAVVFISMSAGEDDATAYADQRTDVTLGRINQPINYVISC